MNKTLEQRIKDALWYLNKPGVNILDEKKAIDILSSIAFKDSTSPKKEIEKIQGAEDPKVVNDLDDLGSYIKGKEVAVIIGHQPGGGAKGERTYNKKVGLRMKEFLESFGAKVFLYEHRTKSYGKRQKEMKEAVNKAQPNNFVCIELHYDAVSYNSAKGHHFQYRGAFKLAFFIADTFQGYFPHSQKRGDNKSGTKLNRTGNGSGFLKEAPGWATLVEPYFISNDAEAEFYKDKYNDIADIYSIGIMKFAKHHAK